MAKPKEKELIEWNSYMPPNNLYIEWPLNRQKEEPSKKTEQIAKSLGRQSAKQSKPKE
jgi:hypothetical protein